MLANASGANLRQGIGSALVSEAPPPGGFVTRDGGVLEVDEVALPAAVRAAAGRGIVR